MTRALGYARLSQDGQDDTETQKERIRDYCDRRGIQLLEIFDDGTYSTGYSDEREAYRELRDRISSDGDDVDAVVVRDTSRIGRDFDERMALILSLRQTDTALHSADRGRIDLSDAHEAAVEGIHAASDDVKKQAEIEHARQAVERRMEQGYHQGRPPFGLEFDRDGKNLVPGDDFEEVVDILELADEGASQREIARQVSPSRSTVRRVLDNREQYEEHLNRAVSDGGRSDV